MNQYEVIRDVGDSLKELLKKSFEEAGFKSVYFYADIPTTEKIKKLPAVSLYMYNINSDERYREREEILVSETDGDGSVVEYYLDAPLPLHLHYALSSFAETPPEEHILLGFAMKVLLEQPRIEADLLKGHSWKEGDNFAVMLRHDTTFDEINALWRGIGEHIRPTAFYWVPVVLDSERRSSYIKKVEKKDLGFGQMR